MTNNKIFGYARVSSKEQNLDRQLDALKAQGIDERDIYTDKASGKDFNRDGYQALLHTLRQGDTLFIVSLDRLGRNYEEIQSQWKHITHDLGADIVVLDMPLLDTRGGDNLDKRFIADLTLQILSYVAQKERDSIKARQKAGIRSAQERGKHMGRPQATKPANWDEVMKQWKAGEITAVKAMELTGTKRTTFYKLVKQDEKNEGKKSAVK